MEQSEGDFLSTKYPKKQKRLTAAFVRHAPPGKHYDGNGLILKVEPGGARRWIQRIAIHGKRREIGLGSCKLVSLRKARELAEGSGLIFPSPTGRTLSDSTISKLVRENGIKAVPHGFRSSFRDWCAETSVPREAAEACLAHVVGGVEGAYARSDLLGASARSHGKVGRLPKYSINWLLYGMLAKDCSNPYSDSDGFLISSIQVLENSLAPFKSPSLA